MQVTGKCRLTYDFLLTLRAHDLFFVLLLLAGTKVLLELVELVFILVWAHRTQAGLNNTSAHPRKQDNCDRKPRDRQTRHVIEEDLCEWITTRIGAPLSRLSETEGSLRSQSTFFQLSRWIVLKKNQISRNRVDQLSIITATPAILNNSTRF